MPGEIVSQRNAGRTGVVVVSAVTLLGACALIAGIWPVDSTAEIGETVTFSLTPAGTVEP